MKITLLFLLLIFPAFFAASELSFLLIRPSKVLRLIEEKRKGAFSILKIQKRFRSSLIASQFGVTISLIAVGWLSKGLANDFWNVNKFSNRIYDLLLFLFIVLIVTLISGLIPKALVINNPESAALRLTTIFDAVRKGMQPIVSVIEFFASACLRLFNLNNKWDSLNSVLSAGELETLIETDNVTGLKPDEKNILEGVFALKDTQVKEVMIPRSEMVTLPKNITFAELMKQVDKTRHARFFVIGESLDDVLGVLDLRYLAKPISKSEMGANTLLEPFLLPVTKVIETCSLAEILPIVRDYNPFLLVVDEHGGTEGLITAADLTGEIVGEEMLNSRVYSDMKMLDNFSKKWSIAGKAEIIEINKKLGCFLPEGADYHTLAGFLLEKFQMVPKIGDSLEFKNIKFEIISMSGPKIDRVKIFLPKS
ncbi:hemolysin family protein [uncultured Prochlorococcus sp.]|jgi:CBS domain containing-hemolysin-like protein|uniref:hemolysin family protein n=1 Tax=Prochlorococcus sp. TaxID=1220 RepID=UPI000DFC9EEC|nr:hemolysin family protein [uncultured Prochlorococcus sp.]MDC3231920.1 hemolysin family protein [Prochlorococcus sp. AH-716-A09]RCL49948.1 MAG: HlyC/CorC family transporter [Prochlorococcus sp. MED-G72]